MVGYALGDLVKQGKVVADSRVDLVKSPIGHPVKSGAPKPDISSADAVKRALLATKTIAYSDSASGVYVSTEISRNSHCRFHEDKARKIPATGRRNRGARRCRDRLPAWSAKLLPVQGIDIVGQLPSELQKVTVFSAGSPASRRSPTPAGEDQISCVSDGQRRIVKSGMEPSRLGATN